MDTLITLGSLSAFIMSVMMIALYQIQIVNRFITADEKDGMVMSISHMLESTGLILVIIKIGKYFEGKAKEATIVM